MKAATLAVVAHTAAAAVNAATWLHYAIFQAAVIAIVSASSMVITLMTRLTGRPGAHKRVLTHLCCYKALHLTRATYACPHAPLLVC